jgi:hypothetical protein
MVIAVRIYFDLADMLIAAVVAFVFGIAAGWLMRR